MRRCERCGLIAPDDKEFTRCPSCLLPCQWEEISKDDARYKYAREVYLKGL